MEGLQELALAEVGVGLELTQGLEAEVFVHLVLVLGCLSWTLFWLLGVACPWPGSRLPGRDDRRAGRDDGGVRARYRPALSVWGMGQGRAEQGDLRSRVNAGGGYWITLVGVVQVTVV